MAPIEINPHSCEFCQKIVINEARATDDGRGEAGNFCHFDFLLIDILNGDANDCSLCTWLCDTEWIHRSATTNEILQRRGVSSEDPNYRVIAAVAEASIRQEQWLPPPEPQNTLRKCCSEGGGTIEEKLRLVCFLPDHLEIRFFALWDADNAHIVYRTRAGFSVFTVPGNPAAASIKTRPIEREVGSKAALARVSRWLHACLHETTRGERIHRRCLKPTEGYMPTRLIEITVKERQYELKLREMKNSPSENYCALSYCWGGEQSIKSTRATLAKWLDHLPWEQLPRTLRHAAIVCHSLNIRYLWIDAFCIIQDDDKDKATEISDMANVYRNSTLTIAASRAASAHEGFLGERSAALFTDQVYELAYQPKRAAGLGSIFTIFAQIDPEPLDTRGWTLQERLLSPRTIEFGSRQMRFICQSNPRGVTDGWRLWAEHNNARQDNLENANVLYAEFDALEPVLSGPDLTEVFDSWYRLIESYTYRHLSVPQDRILAVSGIAERYGRLLGDKYYAGHWRSSLARSLYWKAKDPSRPRPQVPQGPSWSWLSLDGPVEFPRISHADSLEPHVVDINAALRNEAHPYGAIFTNDARLTVKARLNSAVLQFQDGLFGKVDAYASGISLNSAAGDIFTMAIDVDCLEEANEGREANDTVFLELSSLFTNREWCTRGLVARAYGENSFFRIGTFDCTKTKGETETADQWRYRVETEFNWFGGFKAEIYDVF